MRLVHAVVLITQIACAVLYCQLMDAGKSVPASFVLVHYQTGMCLHTENDATQPAPESKLGYAPGCNINSPAQAFKQLPNAAIQHISSGMCISYVGHNEGEPGTEKADLILINTHVLDLLWSLSFPCAIHCATSPAASAYSPKRIAAAHWALLLMLCFTMVAMRTGLRCSRWSRRVNLLCVSIGTGRSTNSNCYLPCCLTTADYYCKSFNLLACHSHS